MAKIADYLQKVSKDSEKVKAFRRDPATALADSDLSAEQQEILASGDTNRIREEIEKESPGRGDVMYETVVDR